MSVSHADKWTVFLMSLIAPGSGQLFALHRSFGLWCVAAAASICGAAYFAKFSPVFSAMCVAIWSLIAMASASHAKHLLEFRPPWLGTPGVTAYVRYETPRRNRIRLGIDVDIPRPASEVWLRIAQLELFLCIDPFHTSIIAVDGPLKVGSTLLLEHHAIGFRFTRGGRLLRWREGEGYSFSDLRRRDPRRGFPHVFHVAVRSTDDARSTRLTIDVRGRWSSKLVPARVGMLWLGWVMREHARLLRAAM
jgi:hypothetical protein